jgi:hypothetical protein
MQEIGFYSRVLEESGYANAPLKLDEYYQNDVLCTTGRTDPLVAIKDFLRGFGWTRSAEEYFMEQFEYESRFLAHDLEGIAPDEILFIDDRQSNLEMAGSFGIACFHAASEESIADLKNRLKMECF